MAQVNDHDQRFIKRTNVMVFMALCIGCVLIGMIAAGFLAVGIDKLFDVKDPTSTALSDVILILGGGILPLVLLMRARSSKRTIGPRNTTELPIEKVSLPPNRSSSARMIPGTYTVMRHPNTLHVKAIRNGFSWLAFSLNVFGFGWIWAFANRATHFGWRLLVLSIGIYLINYLGIPALSVVAGLMWIVFSVTVGTIATDRMRYELKRLGFATIAENVAASSSGNAIDQVDKK